MIILQTNEGGTPPSPREGLIIMTTYNTTTLAIAIMGDETVEANRKAATRTLRKFLRDELGEGKAVVGKGARYALDYNKRELTALAKKFKAWEIAQEEAKIARREALEAAKTPTAPIADTTPESDIEDDTDEELNPDEADIDAMILEMRDEDEDA
jgi:hypothetical protein